MKINNKILIAMWVIILLVSAGFSAYVYGAKKAALLDGIDQKLYTSAIMLRSTVGEDYHNTLEMNSFASEEYDQIIVDRNNKLCEALGLQYLWSNMVVDGDIVFTTSTSPGHDVSKKDHAGFFDVHGDPHAFDEVLGTMKTSYSSFHNEWGSGRMVLVPYVDANGRPHVFGASMSINEVDTILKRTMRDTLFFSLTSLLLGFVISLFVSRSFSRPITRLTNIIDDISKGKLDVEIDKKLKGRSDEVGDLARAFDRTIVSLKMAMKKAGKIGVLEDNEPKI